MSDDSLLDARSGQEIIARVPPPDRGFKRSPALVRLIAFLERPEMVDYVVSYEMSNCQSDFQTLE